MGGLKEIFQELFLRQVEVSWQISGKKEREYPAWGTERSPGDRVREMDNLNRLCMAQKVLHRTLVLNNRATGTVCYITGIEGNQTGFFHGGSSCHNAEY